jgi:hypothetical protein
MRVTPHNNKHIIEPAAAYLVSIVWVSVPVFQPLPPAYGSKNITLAVELLRSEQEKGRRAQAVQKELWRKRARLATANWG